MDHIANKIYADQYHRIRTFIDDVILENRHPQHFLACEDFDGAFGRPGLQAQLFWDALQTRLAETPHRADNLYLMPDTGQQIRMFNFMAEKFPVVRVAQGIANQALINKTNRDKHLVLVDIGMGTGQQMAGMLRQLYEKQLYPYKVTLIGIEPSAESMQKAQQALGQLKAELGVSLDFIGIQKAAEQLNETDWQAIHNQVSHPSGQCLVNASFALHHTRPLASRDTLFRRLKALAPDLLVMIEPYADFTDEDLMARFNHAWHHYGLTFMAIDTIEASEEEKSAVKRVFFGRELPDVLGDGDRVEQYETAEMWIDRLKQAGFNPLPFKYDAPDAFNSLIQLAHGQDHALNFTVKGYPIVSLIGAS